MRFNLGNRQIIDLEPLVVEIQGRLDSATMCAHYGCNVEWLKPGDSVYCPDHECGYTTCLEFCERDSCDAHRCSECEAPLRYFGSKLVVATHCARHWRACNVWGCLNETEKVFCKYHECPKMGCNDKRDCERHKNVCLFEDCPNDKSDEWVERACCEEHYV